jgi:Flavodoxin
MKKILVAYSTWAGATHQVADEIARQLRTHDVEVEAASVGDVKDISTYQAIITGSSIHAGQTNGAFNRFLRKFKKQLSAMPVGVFAVCANMSEENPRARKETLGWLNKTLEKFPSIKPVSIGLFAGAVITEGEDFQKLNFMFRKVVASMKDTLSKDHGKSDFRDWDAIRAWADETYQLMSK